jgi:hypothetical protein
MVSPSYSHAVSMLTSSLIVWFWLQHRRDPSLREITVLGALVGAAVLMRWQDVVFLIVPYSQALVWRAPWHMRFASMATASLAALVVFSPQMVVWHVLYGQPFAIPQGPSFMQWMSPHMVDVLFSTSHGLFTWTPVVALSIWGLVAGFLPRDRAAAPVILGIVLVSWYVNAAVADWWAGEAFGARRFLSLLPFLVLGLATWLQGGGRHAGVRSSRLLIVGALTVANGLLLLQYQVFMKGFAEIAPYPSGWFDMWVTRFVVPVRLMERWFAVG